MKRPIIVVGGGLGGLAAAIHLAARGRRVVLLEKNERVGGKLNIVEENGYTFDTGPSLLTMPWVLRALFAAAGTRLEDELQLIPIEPTCRYRWPDGTRLDAFQSLPLLIEQIRRLDERDIAGFLRFMAYAARIYGVVADPFLLHPFDGLRDLITPALLRDSWKIDPLRTMNQAVRSFFHSPYLRQVFNRYATYNGSSPYRAPATFNLIAYVEFAEGGWYVRGGMYTLARVLERLARRLGVEIRTRSPVERIVVRDGVACGVALAGGEQLDAAAVVVNADPGYTYASLLPTQRQTAARLARLELSCSGFILLLGVGRTYAGLAHHNIFFSGDYRREFAAIFDKRVPAPDPTIYVCASALSDPSHAPPGHTNMFVLVNAPALGPRVDWAREAAGYRDTVVRKLERMGLDALGLHIAYERIITPSDLQARYNAPGGAIYGLASHRPWTAFLRPPLRARDLRQLYFVGGGTHPGGGIPLVLLSGQAVAERLLADIAQFILILVALLTFSACASARSTPALPTADVRRSRVIGVPIVSIATTTPAATRLPPAPEATQSATAIAHQPVLGTPLDQYRAWMEEARTAHPYSESVDVMWEVMICESSGNADEVAGSYHGLFQYDSATWSGDWNPYRASPILDPHAQIFATAKAWQDGNQGWWGCYHG